MDVVEAEVADPRERRASSGLGESWVKGFDSSSSVYKLMAMLVGFCSHSGQELVMVNDSYGSRSRDEILEYTARCCKGLKYMA